VNKAQQFEIVPTEADIVRKIFSLYNDGWGYKKIANYLTDEGIPTPRMAERERRRKGGRRRAAGSQSRLGHRHRAGDSWTTIFTSAPCGRANTPAKRSTARN
jgi:hypothetical protein